MALRISRHHDRGDEQEGAEMAVESDVPITYRPMAHKPYDPAARCEKCGYDCVTTKYVGPQYYQIFTWTTLDPPLDEYLRRECVRCGYGWNEIVTPPVVREIEREG